MDVLKNKTAVVRDYISRYSSFPAYYHSLDNKYIQGTTGHLNTNTPYVLVHVDQSTTLDSLANKYYGRPDYWWIIADFNRISDPFINLFNRYSDLKIPSISSIEFIKEV